MLGCIPKPLKRTVPAAFCRGYGIIELMIAVTLVGVLLAGAYQLFFKSSRSVTDSVSRVKRSVAQEKILDGIRTQITNSVTLTHGAAPLARNAAPGACGGMPVVSGIQAFPDHNKTSLESLLSKTTTVEPSSISPSSVSDAVRVVYLSAESRPVPLKIDWNTGGPFLTDTGAREIVVSTEADYQHFNVGDFVVLSDRLGAQLSRITGKEMGSKGPTLYHGTASVWNDYISSRDFGYASDGVPLYGGASVQKAAVATYTLDPATSRLLRIDHSLDDGFNPVTRQFGTAGENVSWETLLSPVESFTLAYATTNPGGEGVLIRNPRVGDPKDIGACANQLAVRHLQYIDIAIESGGKSFEHLASPSKLELFVPVEGVPLAISLAITPLPGQPTVPAFPAVTPTSAPTSTPTSIPTATPTPTSPPVNTPTPTPTPTITPTPTPTEPPKETPTPTEPPKETPTPIGPPEPTPTGTPTPTPSVTPTPTPSPTATPTPTSTPTPAPTSTPTPTATPSGPTPTPTPTEPKVTCEPGNTTEVINPSNKCVELKCNSGNVDVFYAQQEYERCMDINFTLNFRCNISSALIEKKVGSFVGYNCTSGATPTPTATPTGPTPTPAPTSCVEVSYSFAGVCGGFGCGDDEDVNVQCTDCAGNSVSGTGACDSLSGIMCNPASSINGTCTTPSGTPTPTPTPTAPPSNPCGVPTSTGRTNACINLGCFDGDAIAFEYVVPDGTTAPGCTSVFGTLTYVCNIPNDSGDDTRPDASVTTNVICL